MARVSRKGNVVQIAQPGCMGEQQTRPFAFATSPVTMRTFRTAAYTRLSDEDIRKKISNSIGTQKSMLVNYIQSQPDLQLYKIYEDVNYTGTNFNRPAFTRMFADIQAGLVDCVIVKDLSRFGRNFEETGHFLERVFPFLAVRFISINDNYDSLTASLDESSLIVPLKNLIKTILCLGKVLSKFAITLISPQIYNKS